MLAFIKLLFTAFSQSITSFLYIFVVMMVFVSIKRSARLEESWLGFNRDTMKNQLMYAMLFGMIAGLLASTAIMAAGIVIDMYTIAIIWPLALLLAFINQRYLCFSYAGGIISLISLVFGWPSVNVSAVIGLIGILHLMESLLILVDGHRNALPVVMEHKRFTPVGAFVLNKLWPIPLVILTIPGGMLQGAPGGVAMPGWWPIFHGQASSTSLILLPLAVVLGYGDMAVTSSSKAKARSSALLLGAYSIFILFTAWASTDIHWVRYLAAISAPILHEVIVLVGNRTQKDGNPIYGAPWRGLRILEVYPDSIGKVMGIEPGDVLLNLNGKSINSEQMLREALLNAPSYIWIDVSRQGVTKSLEFKGFKNDVNRLGVIFVPRKSSRFYIPAEKKSAAARLLRKLVKSKKKDVSV